MDPNPSIDVLGIKPVADAINIGVEKTFEGLEGFLVRVCAPALEEVGLLFRDGIHFWRMNNVGRMLAKAKGKLEYDEGEMKFKINPRIALAIIENSSVVDSDELQELWAGLFVASCSDGDGTDENLIFVDILNQLTSVEARILEFACSRAITGISFNGLLLAAQLIVKIEALQDASGIQDKHRLDRELDHLRGLGLLGISGGFNPLSMNLVADLTPSAVALHLYIKTQGSKLSPEEFWNHTP
jgi:hypothetical protein